MSANNCESIEIEKHGNIDQQGKPLDSTWRALFTMGNSEIDFSFFIRTLFTS